MLGFYDTVLNKPVIKMTTGNNTTSTSSSLDSFLQYRIGDYIWIYGSPVLLLVGTVGNILSILVLLRKSMRHSTTMFYLTCLSFGDLFSLYTGLLRLWIRAAFDVDVRTLSDPSCKIHTFLVYVSLDFTVWTLVAVTVDRCLSVSIPFRAKRICSLRRSRYVFCIVLTLAVLKNMHFLWNLGLVHTWEFRCDGRTDEVDYFLRNIWHWIDFSTFCFIPFSVMIVCNIKIIYEIVASQRKVKSHNSLYMSKSPETIPKEITTVSGQLSTTSRVNNANEKTVSQTTSKPHRWKIPSVSVMLLSVNCIFLLTTSPVQAFLIGEQHWFLSDSDSEESLAWHNFWWAIVNMLQYLNNAIHLFLYCLTGPRFRQELRCMFKRVNRVSTVPEKSQTEM